MYLELTKNWFSCNNDCFSKFSSFNSNIYDENKKSFFSKKNFRKTQETIKLQNEKYWVLVRLKWMYSIPILWFDKKFKSIENTNNQYHFESIENTNSIEYSYPEPRVWANTHFKILNTQYHYSNKIVLNTQYFNTFKHFKSIENTITNTNTQYLQLSKGHSQSSCQLIL